MYSKYATAPNLTYVYSTLINTDTNKTTGFNVARGAQGTFCVVFLDIYKKILFGGYMPLPSVPLLNMHTCFFIGWLLGADYLIQGNNVFKFSGANASDWAWTFVRGFDIPKTVRRVVIKDMTFVCKTWSVTQMSLWGTHIETYICIHVYIFF